MKKILTILLALCLVMSLVSCASGKEVSQDQVNAAFAKVYDEFAKSLILDGATTYTVKSGDTLSAITGEKYGADKGYYFPVIMLASSNVVLDPDLIQPGMVLNVPNLEKNLKDPIAKGKLKEFFKEISNVYKKKGNATVQEKLLEISKAL